MSIQFRPILLAFAGFAAVLLVIWGVNRWIVQPAFVELEQAQALEDGARVRAAIQGELRQLDQKSGDWAEWDDAYAFTTTRDPAFIQSNLGDWSVLEKSTQVNLCVILDRRGQSLYSGGYDSDLGGAVLPAAFASAPPAIWSELQPGLEQEQARAGLLLTEHGLLLLVARPILTTQGMGPARGLLIFGRFLDEPHQQALAEQTQVAFDLLLVGDPRLTTDEQTFWRTLPADKPTLRPGPGGALFVYEALPDLTGQPVALLRTPIRQTISATAQRTSRTLMGALGLVTLALLLGQAWWSTRAQQGEIAATAATAAAWGIATLVVLVGLTLTAGLSWELQRQGLLTPGNFSIQLLGGAITLLLALYLFALASQRQRAEMLVAARTAELQASEDRFRRIVDHAPFGFHFYRLTTDDRLVFVGANSAADAILKFTHANCVGQPLEVCLPVLASTEIQDMYRRLARAGGTSTRKVVEHRDQQIAGSFEVVAFQTAPGTIAVAFTDITERQRAEAELRQRDRLLQATADAMALLLSDRDLNEAVGAALGTLGAATDADRAYIFENHSDLATGALLLSLRYEWCAHSGLPQIDNPQFQNLPYKAFSWRWHHTLEAGGVIKGLAREFPEAERAILESQAIRAILVLPIRIEDRFWGFIGFDDCRNERIWSVIEENILRTAAAALGHTYVRRRAETALQASEKKLRDIANNIPGVVYQFYARPNGDQGLYYFSERAHELLGINAALDEALMNFITQVAPEDQESFIESIQQAVATTSPWDFEGRFIKPAGEVIWFKVISHPTQLTNELVFTGVILDITERKQAEQIIEHLAYYDALTDLPNRTLLAQRAELALALAARRQENLAVLLLDLDRFKEVNDALGHTEGDALLMQVAARIQALIRAEDTACRPGGDEFLLLLPEADQEGALRVANKMLTAFRQPFNIAGHSLTVTASVGIALYPHDGADFAELLKNADTALYRAKHEGRNTSTFYARQMNVATFERLVLEGELRQAIQTDQLRAHYQPKVRLSDRTLVGAEALVRWQHPERGLIPPGQFISVAEASDLIVALGDWMLIEVCRQLAVWRRQGWRLRTVAVNLAARHFRRPGLADQIRDLLAAEGLPPSVLELELTESTLLEANAYTAETLKQLQQFGVGLALDDFGTGYSSLSYLKRLPLTTLKIDQSFVRDMVIDADDRTLAATIVTLGHQMELKVVAEGVETEEQRQILLEQGCDLAQGYLFDRPLPADEFAAAWLASAPEHLT